MPLKLIITLPSKRRLCCLQATEWEGPAPQLRKVEAPCMNDCYTGHIIDWNKHTVLTNLPM